MKIREIMKRTMAIGLAAAMLLQSQSVVTLAETVQADAAETAVVDVGEETSVSGNTESKNTENDNENETLGIVNEIEAEETDSFGEFLADQINESQEQKDKYKGYTISSVNMDGNKATVTYNTLVDAYILVGIYSEDSKSYIGSGYEMVPADKNETTVDVSLDNMPDYYYVRVYLVNIETYGPLCPVYESNYYTKEMQDLLALTTDQFDDNRIYNLDEDKTNNFGVFADGVIIDKSDDIEEQTIIETDTGYKIENASQEVLALQTGDVYAFEDENGLLIFKVNTIQIEGTTVLIGVEDTDVEEVFQYLKIDMEATPDTAEYDDVGLDEDITYLGQGESAESDIDADNFSGTLKTKTEFKYQLDKNTEDHLSGYLKVGLAPRITYYITHSLKYFELGVDYEAGFEGEIKVDNDNLVLGLGTPKFRLPGCSAKFAMGVGFEASAKVSIDIIISGKAGFRISTDDGITDLTSKPQFKTEVAIEGKVYFGLILKAEAEAVSKRILSVDFEGKIGGELQGNLVLWSTSPDLTHHSCNKCIDGDINFVLRLNEKAVVGKKNYSYSLADSTTKIADWYYSFDHNELGWGVCPYTKYDVTIITIDKSNNKVDDAKVEIEKSDFSSCYQSKEGEVKAVLSPGTYIVRISKEGYKAISQKLIIKDENRNLKIKLEKGKNKFDKVRLSWDTCAVIDDTGTLYMSGDGSPDKKSELTWVMNGVKDIQLGMYGQIILKEDGSAWTRGNNRWGQIGNGTKTDDSNDEVNIPYNVMNNISSIYAGCEMFACVDKNGALWTWGYNGDAMLGQGKDNEEMSESVIPKCILKNVDKVVLPTNSSGICAAITKERDLYIWGEDFGNTPEKIMDDVEDLSIATWGRWCLIKKKDNSLWGLGANEYGQLGIGNTIGIMLPQKIDLSNVDKMGTIEVVGYAITSTGDLYMWGGHKSEYGQEPEDSCLTDSFSNNLKPTKIMSNVKKVCGEDGCIIIITQNGSLYGIGHVYDYLHDIGDGSKIYRQPEYLNGDVSDIVYANPDCPDILFPIWGIIKKDKIEIMGDNTFLFPEYTVHDGVNWLVCKETRNFETINFASENSAVSVTSQELDVNTADDEKVVQYTDLNPNELYNFYQLRKNDNIQDVLEAENLLYVTQSRADANGSLEIVYTVSEEQELGDKILVGESEKIDSDLDSTDPIPTPNPMPTPTPNPDPTPSPDSDPTQTPEPTPATPASTSVYTYEVLTDGTIRIMSCQTSDVDLVIPDTIDGYVVTEIGTSAFANQTSIQTVKFPANLKQIGVKAFENCTGLLEVTLPDTITGAGQFCFSGCTALKKAVLNKGRINIVYGMFANCTSLTEVVIPDTVENVAKYAFLNCRSLTHLNLPASLKLIDMHAFDGAGITTITYAGTKAQWQKVKKNLTGNGSFITATVTDSTGTSFTVNGSNTDQNSQTSVKKPAKATIKKVKNYKYKKNSFTVSWKKVSKARGYQVQIATDKKFKKNKKTKNSYGCSYVFSKLKEGKTYYVRVRAYVYDDNYKKVYGSWSKTKKIKMKK